MKFEQNNYIDDSGYKAEYIKILKDELKPALGCTEPIAIAYCAAKAASVLEEFPNKVVVKCSGNVIKNVQSVKIPNSGGLMGVVPAAVLGIVGGDSSKKLETLETVKQEHREKTKELLKDKNFCTCDLIEGENALNIIVMAFSKEHEVLVEIKHKHLNIIKIEKDGSALLTNNDNYLVNEKSGNRELLNVKNIYSFAKYSDMSEVFEELEKQISRNTAIANEGLKNEYGAKVGKTLFEFYDSSEPRIKARAMAAAASDARMGGCSLPVIINSGSGNQGIAVSLPIVVYAAHLKSSKELLLRALALANLISIHQKRYIGDLSAYCGATSAACAAACGIAFLQDASYQEISDTITNTIANIGGMVCDGAKASCAAKISSAIEAALMGYDMQKNGGVFDKGEGLVKDNVEKTIQSYGRMASKGMKQTDVEILNIMLNK